jgi:hypothetical protein
MSDVDVFDTEIDMEPLRKLMWDWWVVQFTISRNPSEDKFKEDLRHLEFRIVDYVEQAAWKRDHSETEEERAARKARYVERRVAHQKENVDERVPDCFGEWGLAPGRCAYMGGCKSLNECRNDVIRKRKEAEDAD